MHRFLTTLNHSPEFEELIKDLKRLRIEQDNEVEWFRKKIEQVCETYEPRFKERAEKVEEYLKKNNLLPAEYDKEKHRVCIHEEQNAVIMHSKDQGHPLNLILGQLFEDS